MSLVVLAKIPMFCYKKYINASPTSTSLLQPLGCAAFEGQRFTCILLAAFYQPATTTKIAYNRHLNELNIDLK